MTGPASATGRRVRASVVQAAPVLFDTPRSLQKLADLAADAARQRAELVVFPEAFVGGYPKGHDFGVSVGVRTPEGRDEFRRLFESAVEVPGPATAFLGAVARAHGVHLVVGVAERDGGTLFCSSLIFGPDGSLLGTHRKLMPTAMERVMWGSGDGSTLPVVPTPLGRIGAVICWENYMPLLRTAVYAKGVELYCAVTVDDRDTWVPTMRHVALEGRCFVMSACQFLTRSDLPSGYPAERFPASQDVLIRGGSCIVGPLGELLAGPKYDEECVLTADLDRADLARAKFDFDVVGHYARPDVFRLRVNEQPMRSVVFENQPDPPRSAPCDPSLTLLHVPGSFAVCKLATGDAVPPWATTGDTFSVTRTADELSVVCRQQAVPEGVVCERGWRGLRVAGAMPFSVVGVLASLTTPVARAGVGVFAFSTFDTDYLLVKETDLQKAVAALRAAGHEVRALPDSTENPSSTIERNGRDDGQVARAIGPVRIRNVTPDDLPRMFEMQLDPESNRLAVTIPRSREAFDTHWAKALADPVNTTKAVLFDGEMVGYISCFPMDGRANVGYWISREHWGKGIASRALGLLLLEVVERPVYALVATSNGASLRVLQKCGFVVERVQVSPATDRYPECEEAVLVLTG